MKNTARAASTIFVDEPVVTICRIGPMASSGRQYTATDRRSNSAERGATSTMSPATAAPARLPHRYPHAASDNVVRRCGG